MSSGAGGKGGGDSGPPHSSLTGATGLAAGKYLPSIISSLGRVEREKKVRGGEGDFDDGRKKVLGHSPDRKWSDLGEGGTGLCLFTKVEVCHSL